MSIKVIHLHALTYPVATTPAVAAYAAALARAHGARLEVTISRPIVKTPTHWLSAVTMKSLADTLVAQTRRAATDFDAAISDIAAQNDVSLHCHHVTFKFPAADENHGWMGRAADLCILGWEEGVQDQHRIVEDWIFQSGGGVLICPNDQPARRVDTIVVAWDFSRAAARAMKEALPFLQSASAVRLLVVHGEKDLPQQDVVEPALSYLSAHGVYAKAEVVGLDGDPIGEAILRSVESAQADLLVMGAFGHARAAEFLLGGATKGVLRDLRTPVLFAH